MSVASEDLVIQTSAGAFDASNLTVERVVIHRIHNRAPDKTIQPPICSSALTVLPQRGREALEQRIVAALGSRSHGVEMSIEAFDTMDFFQAAAHAIHLPDTEFIELTHEMAQLLTRAQGSTSAPAGMLAVVTGRVGNPQKRFLAVIKADIQDGFGTGEDAATLAMTYLQNLVLTPTQRFYKVGLLVEQTSSVAQSRGTYDPSNYRAFLFDHLITATETRQAAAYFYQHFLGMDIQKSSKKLTKDFFEYTKGFIASASLSEEQKFDAKDALRVELKSASSIISASDYANAHLPHDVRTDYLRYMKQKGFPRNAIAKDTQFVSAQLRRPRKLKFVQGIQLTIPPDVPTSLISIAADGEETVVRIASGYREED